MISVTDSPQVSLVEGRLSVSVPWKKAERLQEYLRVNGVGTTLILDPSSHEARLEAWPEQSTDLLQFLVVRWESPEEKS